MRELIRGGDEWNLSVEMRALSKGKEWDGNLSGGGLRNIPYQERMRRPYQGGTKGSYQGGWIGVPYQGGDRRNFIREKQKKAALKQRENERKPPLKQGEMKSPPLNRGERGGHIYLSLKTASYFSVISLIILLLIWSISSVVKVLFRGWIFTEKAIDFLFLSIFSPS